MNETKTTTRKHHRMTPQERQTLHRNRRRAKAAEMLKAAAGWAGDIVGGMSLFGIMLVMYFALALLK